MATRQKKTDIVYVVGNGSRWNNNELRYSLRSIAKYGKNIGRVIIAGDCPDWVNTEEVIHVPCRDMGSVKHVNIAMKIYEAIQKVGLREPFLISSDDHFYTREVDFATYPHYYRKELRTEPCATQYSRSLYETRKWLEAHELPTLMTNPHANTWIDPKVFDEVLGDVRYCKDAPDGLEINCVMGNIWKSRGGEVILYKDGKQQQRMPLRMWVLHEKEHECVSIADTAIEVNFVRWIREKYPEKCRYEK